LVGDASSGIIASGVLIVRMLQTRRAMAEQHGVPRTRMAEPAANHRTDPATASIRTDDAKVS